MANDIGYVPEDRLTQGLFMDRSIQDNTVASSIRKYMKGGKLDEQAMETVTRRWIDEINIVAPSPKPAVRTLSGGNAQKVVIAKWLNTDPKLFILDEPETGLDFHNQILVLNMVERLAHEEGISAIMNTHYPTNAMSVADEALMLNRKGEFFYGPAAAILNEQNISYSFDVQVIVDELNYQGRAVRSIVPVALRGNAV